MTPEISVVLPVYNAAPTLKHAVQSILNQSFQNFELIIVDDGSTDGCLSTIKPPVDSRIRILSTTNRGIARALNFGIKLSLGAYIARMDADDEASPDRLSEQLAYLKANPELGVVSSLVSYVGDAGKNQGYAHYVAQINKLATPEQLFTRRFQESPIAHPTVMFRKELVYRYGGYQESNVPEDYELWLRWMHQGVIFGKVKKALLNWSDHPSRLSRTHQNYCEVAFNAVKARYLYLHLRKTFSVIPPLWIWGTGKQVNKAVEPLRKLGLLIDKYIDVKTHTGNQERIIHYTEVSAPGHYIILSYVRDRSGKKAITTYLNDRGYTEGKDFYLMN